MPEKTIDPESAATSARALLERSVEDRVAAVRTLVAAINDVDTADAAARDARDAHSKAWDAALASGWSDKDLRATGARAPGPARVRKSRPRATTPRQESPQTEQPNTGSSGDSHHEPQE